MRKIKVRGRHLAEYLIKLELSIWKQRGHGMSPRQLKVGTESSARRIKSHTNRYTFMDEVARSACVTTFTLQFV